MKARFTSLALAGLAAALLQTQAACTQKAPEAEAQNPALATPVPVGMVRGTVLETMDGGGYTYALIDTETDQRWVASQQIPVGVGDVVQVSQGMPMQAFQRGQCP